MGHAFRAVVTRALLFLPLARAAHAEPAEPAAAEGAALRLADVVAVAVRQAPDLARARIDLDTARAQLTRAEGSEDTHLSARAATTVIGAPATDPTGDSDSEQVTLSASRALSTGGTVTVSAIGVRDHQIGTVTKNGMPTSAEFS
ncbi:MAG TPA: hypothetical protein VK601_06935, partial [Kofleriaceae bacterium]|nr:hypothetical protein [Kofleriaceae bacterium]